MTIHKTKINHLEKSRQLEIVLIIKQKIVMIVIMEQLIIMRIFKN